MKKSYELYEQILQERGWSSYRLCMAARIPQSCPSLWKSKGWVPKYQRMSKIAAALSTPEHPVTPEDFYKADQAEGGEK